MALHRHYPVCLLSSWRKEGLVIFAIFGDNKQARSLSNGNIAICLGRYAYMFNLDEKS